MEFFEKEKLSALQAKEEAQWITFAPFVFQATRVLRDSGILSLIESNRQGMTLDEVTAAIKLPPYGIRVLIEAALGIGLLILKDGKYKITKTTYFILHDELTKVNMDFTHDVCYNGMYFLEESIKNQKPEGLKSSGTGRPYTRHYQPTCQTKQNPVGFHSIIFILTMLFRKCYPTFTNTSQSGCLISEGTLENGLFKVLSMILMLKLRSWIYRDTSNQPKNKYIKRASEIAFHSTPVTSSMNPKNFHLDSMQSG